MNFSKYCNNNRQVSFLTMKHHSLLTYMYSSKLPLKLGYVPPDAALWALVLLYALGLRRSDLHTFPMVPPLTYITTNPKLVGIVITATAPAKCFTVLVFLLLLITVIHRKLWVAFDLPVTGSLRIKVKFYLTSQKNQRNKYITRKGKTLTLVLPRDLLPLSAAGLLSLIGFLSVTISKTVGSSLIKLNKRFLP